MEFVKNIINLPKHFKSAFQNLRRNTVMSISSILTVTFTLLLIGFVGLAALNVEKMAGSVEESLTVYCKVDRSLTDEEGAKLEDLIMNIDGVQKAEFSTKDQELDKIIESQNDAGKKLFETYRKNNPLGCAYTITVKDDSNIETVAKSIENIEEVSEVNYGGETTSSLIKTLKIVRNACVGVAVVLGIFALFLIANTIKMAIESRNEEIKIMRLVGASNGYIRLPYMLEGMLIGFFGSILPVVAIAVGYPQFYKVAHAALPNVINIIKPYPFVLQLSGATLALGMLVGMFGSLNAIRKYLKH